jgi:hypothetical protein
MGDDLLMNKYSVSYDNAGVKPRGYLLTKMISIMRIITENKNLWYLRFILEINKHAQEHCGNIHD